MDLLFEFVEIFLHLDKHLPLMIEDFGRNWSYIILFLVIFCETGLVVMPVLPGDSLLFATGAMCATTPPSFNISVVLVLLIIAAVLGDTVNYWIGKMVGPKVFRKDTARFLNKKHLERTRIFYEKHGGVTIILARFMPFLRTFAPFVAGVGAMSYGRFITYNIVGGTAWITLFLLGGYFFGNVPIVKHNFSIVIMAIVLISVVPPFIEYARTRIRKNKQGVTPSSPPEGNAG